LLSSAQGPLHVAVKPMTSELGPAGKLVLVHDMSFVTRRSEETKRYVFYFFMALAAVVSLITVIIAQLSWRGWMAGMRSLLRGEGLLRQPEAGAQAGPSEFKPIARDLQRLVRELEAETRARDESQITWTPEALRAILHGELRGEDVIVVSNREPYIHQRRGDRIEVQRPASGLVTALEPIMRACSGTWIAHGSGSADREVVDRHDRVAVPPDKPAYQIRRVWLTAEEEAGYYYGFANEGLWPLCHIAHVRPTFRSGDWAHYVAVNRKFAEAVVAEAKTKSHRAGAGLPLRAAAAHDPRGTARGHDHHLLAHSVAQSGILLHLPLGRGDPGRAAGQQHPRLPHPVPLQQLRRHRGSLLEARVDRESFTVSLGGKLTAVRRYPISIAWPPEAELMQKDVALPRRHAQGERPAGRTTSSASASIASTTPRASSNAFAPSSACWN
jgi:trehalose 6-phosphate synthase